MGNAKSTPQSPPYDGLPPVEAADFEASPLPRDRRLKHLLRLNHQDHSVLYSRMRFHNHLPHAVGSAYFLGADAEHLSEIYDSEAEVLEPWADSPHEVCRHDWREYLSERKLQRAYLDFFEDELVRMGYEWKRVVAEYLFKGPEPVIFGAIGGLGHPIIHLGYAFELNSKDVAMEALTLFTTNYNFLHKYIDAEFPTPADGPPVDASPPPAPNASTSPLEILERIRTDATFDGLFAHPGADNIQPLFTHREAAVLSYFHQLAISDVAQAHKDINHLTALLLTTTHEPGHPTFDFFVVHLTTVSYAVRTLLPELPVEFALPLVKAQWLFVIVVYIIQLRRKIRPELLESIDIGGKGWGDVVAKALSRHKDPGANMEDAHYLKAVRAMRDSAALWKDEDEFYMKAGVKFAWEFEKWSFGSESHN